MSSDMSSGSKAPNRGSKRSNTPSVEQDLFADFGLEPITPKDIGASMANQSSTSTTARPKSTPLANQAAARRDTYKNNRPTHPSPVATSTPFNPNTNNFAANPNPTPTTAMLAYLTDMDRANKHIHGNLTALEKHTDAKLKALHPADPRRQALISEFLTLKQATLALQTAVLKMRAPLTDESRLEAKKAASLARLPTPMRWMRQQEDARAEREDLGVEKTAEQREAEQEEEVELEKRDEGLYVRQMGLLGQAARVDGGAGEGGGRDAGGVGKAGADSDEEYSEPLWRAMQRHGSASDGAQGED